MYEIFSPYVCEYSYTHMHTGHEFTITYETESDFFCVKLPGASADDELM